MIAPVASSARHRPILATLRACEPRLPGTRRGPSSALGPAGRVPSGAQAGGASRNSLRGLRPLRSDKRAEYEDEARCARRPQPCAPYMDACLVASEVFEDPGRQAQLRSYIRPLNAERTRVRRWP
jgi:hypothetical protein